MLTDIRETITFGKHGNWDDCQIAGWSSAEDGHTWSDGFFCSLGIEAPEAPFGFFIEADWRPALNAPFISRQIVIVEINSQVIATFSVDRPGPFAFYCPAQPKSDQRLVIGFRLPTAFRPCDSNFSHDKRRLGLSFSRIRIAVLREPWRVIHGESQCARISHADAVGMKKQAEQITGVPLERLFHKFEMLAGNCDLGLALRELEFEKLSLLRFGGASVSASIKGIENNFSGLGERISLSIADNPMREWMVSDEFGLSFHSGKSSLTTDKAALEKSFPRYVEFLRRKFLEDLDEASKVFVYADHKDYSATRGLEDCMPLYLALRRRSRSKLLWVCPSSNDPHVKGSVREVLPGLAIGRLDPTAPPVLIGGGITVSGWLTVLCNAWRVFEHTAEGAW